MQETYAKELIFKTPAIETSKRLQKILIQKLFNKIFRRLIIVEGKESKEF